MGAVLKEVFVLRVLITLECTDCKERNYSSTKNKRNHPDRMEFRKYCPRCNGHTLHRETK
ncbi:50S ribosomal protein L33 [Kroppenstedtia eburnea]|uniref:50S ribosomal protein L33 n=1 Tax=Kroppenstedtia eburnea TaxID=714067 RepID=UPI003641557D